MRIASPLYALGAAAIVLAGCSGGGSSAVAPGTGIQSGPGNPAALHGPVSMVPREMLLAPPTHNLVFRTWPDVAAQGLYVASFSATTINEYKVPNSLNHAPFCMVSGVSSVNLIGVQPGTRNLYIPNGGSATIIIRKPACGGLVGTLSDPNGQPSDVAFNDTTGTRYVSNIFNTGGTAGKIQVYKKTDHTPSSQLSDPSMFELVGIDTDKAGNVWQAYITAAGGPGLIEFIAGKMPGHVHTITGPVKPGGLDIDILKNMVIVDINTTTPAAYVYKPPYTGAPAKVIKLKAGSVGCSLDVLNKNLYVSDFTNGTVDVYKWPSGTYEYSISKGLVVGNIVEGVAIDLPDHE